MYYSIGDCPAEFKCALAPMAGDASFSRRRHGDAIGRRRSIKIVAVPATAKR